MEKVIGQQNKVRNWVIFIKERFDPFSHSLMIVLFVLAHFLLAKQWGLLSASVGDLVLILTGSTLFFFKLRLYDEIKDYETDIKINPNRPLPRGLLHHNDLHRGIVFCLVMEMTLFYFVSMNGSATLAIAAGYSLLMFKEFFIGKLIRPHLTTYAVSHTVVTVGLSLAIFSALSNQKLEFLDSRMISMAIVSWFLFNIFEFGRKTFLSKEERNQVESYSKIFGRYGAVLLTLVQALIAGFILIQYAELTNSVTMLFYSTATALLIITGLAFAISDEDPWGKVFRGYSSGFIVLFYTAIIVQALI